MNWSPKEPDVLELSRFFKACNPTKTLAFEDEVDRQYYIDFAPVRGSDLIRELQRTINLSGSDPTCQLFTGHIGCGKSTELLRLKADLEAQKYHTVYFESSQDLDLADIDVTDILLAIARRVSASLEAIGIRLRVNYFTALFQDIADLVQTPIDIDVEADLSVGIGKITAKTRESPKLRDQIRQYLEPRTSSILEVVNRDLFGRAKQELQKKQQKDLVVIVDNLDRVDSSLTPSGKTQPVYLFIDRGEQLKRLNCHVVYTIPMVLVFSNYMNPLINRFGTDPRVLPMVPVKLSDGRDCDMGIALLRQMVLARAFPAENPIKRLESVTQIFDQADTLDRLCRISGGHVRNLLVLLHRCILQENPPISRTCLERIITQRRNELRLAITEDEWQLLLQVAQQKRDVRGEEEYQLLLRSMFVFEYRYESKLWFDVNPILMEP
ncbi:MAG: P-loop NTPase fold protein [Synechococcales bacterium]|nr:P-loop NTPase fold protein [Synechococcales bacterium]